MSDPTTVFVVDDAESIRRIVTRALARSHPHARIRQAASAVAARAELKSSPVDALITDFHLEDGSGLEIAAEARRSNPSMPVVVMSSDHGVADAVLAAGAWFLPKPFELADLMAVLQRLLAASGAEASDESQ